MNDFSYGDRVVYIGSDSVSRAEKVVGVVVQDTGWDVRVLWDHGSSNGYLWESAEQTMTYTSVKKISEYKEESMGIVKKIKELSLSSDERLLRRVGLREDGGWTEDAKDILIDILLDERRDDIVAKAKAVEAEEKKSKKDK